MAEIKFGIDGWRAVFARDFTFDNCRLLSQSIVNQTSRLSSSGQGLVVAYDNRFMSDEFARECARVIAGNGIKTYLVRRPATSALAAFAVQQMEATGALMVTGGSSPHHVGGINYISSDCSIASEELTESIELEAMRIIESGRLYQIDLAEAENLALYKEIEPERAYMDSLKRLIKAEYFAEKNLKVIVDPLFGTGLPFLEKILSELGCEVKTIHNYRDPLFGGFCPEAGRENLIALQRAVLTQQAEIGLAVDGDAGGFGIIDKDGSYIEANMVLSILLSHFLQTRSTRGPVARSLATTHLLDRIARKYGLPVVETPVGFKYLGRAMSDKGCILAAEESGGLSITGHIPSQDGVLACLLATEAVAYSGRSFSELQFQLMEEYGQTFNAKFDIALTCTTWEYMEILLSEMNIRNLAGNRVSSCTWNQGLKIVFENGNWVLVRKSSNYDVLRIYIEGENDEQVEVIKDALLDTLDLKNEKS